MKNVINIDGIEQIIPPFAIAIRAIAFETIDAIVDSLPDIEELDLKSDAVKFEVGVLVFGYLDSIAHRYKVSYEFGCMALSAYVVELFSLYKHVLPVSVGEPFEFISKKLAWYSKFGHDNLVDIYTKSMHFCIKGAASNGKIKLDYPMILVGFLNDTILKQAIIVSYTEIMAKSINMLKIIYENCNYYSTSDDINKLFGIG